MTAPAPTPLVPPAPMVPEASPTSGGMPAGHTVVPEPVAPKRSGRTWALLVAVVAVLVAGVGAFFLLSGGGDGGDADGAVDGAQYSLAAAAQQAAEARTVTFDMEMEAGPLGALTMTGAADRDAQLMTMSMDMGDVMGIGEGSVEMILDVAGGVMYMSADGFGDMMPVQAEWFSIDLATMAEMNGQSLDDLRDEFAFDPTASAALLLGEDAVELGIEEIDGEQVKHYQVTVDLAAALAATPQAQQQLDESGLGLGDELPETIVYDVWVTGDNRLRRMAFELPVMGEELRTRMDFRSVDEPLEVEIPDASDVVDLTEMMGL